MKPGFRTALAIVLALLWAICGRTSAQTAAQVGDVFVGTCDSAQNNTLLEETDVYTNQGQARTRFNGPGQNSCLTNMTFDLNDNLYVISAHLGTASSDVWEFDNLGHLIGNLGTFSSPNSIAHDQQGNFYVGLGSTILRKQPNGSTSTYVVAGGAKWVSLAPDQHTIVYVATNGDVKSFDVTTQTQGPDLVLNAAGRMIRTLPDNSLLLDSGGAISHWVPKCGTCTRYKLATMYQLPANADSLGLDPDGISFWTINTYYDNPNQLGHADVYRTNIRTGALIANFSLGPLTNGRHYSGNIGIDGDGMNTTASATASLAFPAQAVGTTSSTKTAVLTNTGTVVMTVSRLTVGGDFAVKKTSCRLGVLPGASCNVYVTFSPTQVGNLNGTLWIYDNAGNSPQAVALSGIGKGASNTSLSSSLNPSTYGQTVVLTAQVTSNAPTPPTGTVTFMNGSQNLGKATLNNGVATLAKSNLPAGTLSIVANYSGDAMNMKSSSPPLDQVVFVAVTTTTVASSVNPSKLGQSVKFTATVHSPTVTPTGSVTFTAGTLDLGTANLAKGKASVTSSSLPAGTITVTATYAGTANISGSAGAIDQTVQ